ncbi:MAG: hypothetical protein V4436_02130 [Patescibacteria group bacterium]
MFVQQEIVLTFRDDAGDLVAVAEQNGSTKFHNTSKMLKDDVAALLMENNRDTEVKGDILEKYREIK